MAVDIHLELSNGIKGESIDKTHKDKISILNWSWSMSQQGTTHSATGGGAGKASFGDLHLTKYLDLSSTDLIKALSSGRHIDEAKLYVRKAGGDNPLTYFELQMKEVLVSSFNTGAGDGSDLITETFSLNFKTFKIVYHRQNEKGQSQGKVEAEWNIAKNEAKYG